MRFNNKDNRSVSKLTQIQIDILNFIKENCASFGVSPSFREIQRHFEYKAIGTVQGHIKALIKKGYLGDAAYKQGKKKSQCQIIGNSKRSHRVARTLVPKGFHLEQGVRQIPIYGEVAAGSTRDTVQLELGTITISDSVSTVPCFALRVVGNSMQDVGIIEGDLLIVQRQNHCSAGDIVVALLHGETTVKRYVIIKGKTYLAPENKLLRPIEVTQDDFQIQGKVIGLQRIF